MPSTVTREVDEGVLIEMSLLVEREQIESRNDGSFFSAFCFPQGLETSRARPFARDVQERASDVGARPDCTDDVGHNLHLVAIGDVMGSMPYGNENVSVWAESAVEIQ